MVLCECYHIKQPPSLFLYHPMFFFHFRTALTSRMPALAEWTPQQTKHAHTHFREYHQVGFKNNYLSFIKFIWKLFQICVKSGMPFKAHKTLSQNLQYKYLNFHTLFQVGF